MDTLDKPKIKFEPLKTHQTYRLLSGEKVPGASTVAKLCGDSFPLMFWAWTEGCEGRDFRKTSGQAMEIGTLAHWMAETHLKGLEPDLDAFAPDLVDKATNSYLKWLFWWEAEKFKVISSELQLTSEKHKFGGTLDILAEDNNGRMVLIDLKTSKSIYPEHFIQTAGYEELALESGRTVERVIVCRIGKKQEADFEARECFDRRPYFTAFLAALNLYRALQTIK